MISGISVVMPVFNGVGFIQHSLPALIAMQQRGEVLEVIVVDDGSTDATIELAQQLGAKIMHSGGRLGPGGARNVAAHEAAGDVLWFVDADVVVHEDAALAIAKGFDDDNVVGVFGSYDDHPTATNFFSQYKNLVHHYYHQHAKEVAQTFWSGCGAVRREAFLAVGGFDIERYKYPSIEDIELGHRLLAAGGGLRLRREVQCTHLKVWRLGNLLHTEIFRRAIPWSRLIISSGEGIPNDLNVGMAEQGRALVAGILVLMLLVVASGFLSPVWLLASLVVTLLVNTEICQFFLHRGGFLFACKAFLFHQIYYLYSAAAFVLVYIEQLFLRAIGRAT